MVEITPAKSAHELMNGIENLNTTQIELVLLVLHLDYLFGPSLYQNMKKSN